MEKRYDALMICIYLILLNLRRRIAFRKGNAHDLQKVRKTDRIH